MVLKRIRSLTAKCLRFEKRCLPQELCRNFVPCEIFSIINVYRLFCYLDSYVSRIRLETILFPSSGLDFCFCFGSISTGCREKSKHSFSPITNQHV
ncbi:unnamed protein product [Acanthoscelides obtectus]|uniref:Uncharacterized protein n=1 Tax=Acanthoscelides obtectus TaxID=200917 RepID=A0A9P0KTZ9_ACAOB|nr:unnamed protein product [Acanthoscelides obtectus]CAK1674577.1 hypothetical protein AOBTE_LOCUS29668 [Acanthoscelides obtectus]